MPRINIDNNGVETTLVTPSGEMLYLVCEAYSPVEYWTTREEALASMERHAEYVVKSYKVECNGRRIAATRLSLIRRLGPLGPGQ